jgi:single-stranded-DNA-specific exonuclease
VSGARPGQITAETIGFGLGPRINAAGRLDHAYTAAKLLAVNNKVMARQLANELNALNKKRQQLTRSLADKAETMVSPQDPILIAAADDFLSGVVGLVASRLAEKNYRPAIVIERGETESRGSCRSIPEFHITEALDEVEPLLERYGGHAQAAGFTVANENLAAFEEQITAVAADRLAGLTLQPTITADAEIALEEIDWALHGTLAQLEPTGYANAAPIFLSRNVEVLTHRRVGRDKSHLQLRLRATNGGYSYKEIPAIAFRQGAWGEGMPGRIDLVYTLNVNEWNGRRNLQLIVQDIRPALANE